MSTRNFWIQTIFLHGIEEDDLMNCVTISSFLRGVFLCIATCVCSATVAAEIKIFEEGKLGVSIISPIDLCFSAIFIKGPIVAGDARVLEDKVKKIKSLIGNYTCPLGSTKVWLISKGGDISEAMAIGRIIRKNTMMTIVGNRDLSEIDQRAKCFSACVLILAGGVKREVFHELGVIGIHRPYFDRKDGTESIEKTRASRRKMASEIAQYLDEMDINPSLLEDMMAASPSEIRVLSPEETKRYRLSVDDANFEEVEVLKQAKKYGLSTSEYRRRAADAEARCQIGAGDVWCSDAIILGVSKEEFSRRLDQARSVCLVRGSTSEKNACIERIIYRGEKN